MDQNIRNRKDRTLNTRRKTDTNDLDKNVFIDTEFFDIQSAHTVLLHQTDDDQSRGYRLRNDRCQRYTGYVHMEIINEDKIEKIKMTTGSATIRVILKGEGEEETREKMVLVPSVQAFMEMVQEKVDKEGKKIELKASHPQWVEFDGDITPNITELKITK